MSRVFPAFGRRKSLCSLPALSGNPMRRSRLRPSLDPDRGLQHEGDVLRLGLTALEIDGVWSRLGALLDRIDAGEIATF